MGPSLGLGSGELKVEGAVTSGASKLKQMRPDPHRPCLFLDGGSSAAFRPAALVANGLARSREDRSDPRYRYRRPAAG